MLLFRLLAAALGVVIFPLRLLQRARLPDGAYVHVTIDGLVVDIVARPRLWEWRRVRSTSLYALDELVTALAADRKMKGLLVTLRGFKGGMATATSLRSILVRAREHGKDVVVHLPIGAETKETYIATGASRIFVGPQATVAPLGFAVVVRYLRRALDKAGIEPEVLARGEYKSAGEQLVRESMSAPQKEQLGALLDVFHERLTRAIAEGRGVTIERAREIVDQAPYRATDAVAAKLVDGMAYEDQLLEILGPLGQKVKLVDGIVYLALARAALFRPLRAGAHIAVIPVHGPIMGDGGSFRDFTTDEKTIRLAKRARKDKRVRGVILHIDSPGGSALASDRMHHELMRLAREKPLVACMSDVAASGGYYVAAAAHAIVAQPTTVTGSIGVIAARLVAEPLMARLGISTEIVKRGARASMLSPLLPLDEQERAAILREIDATYRAFVDVVAQGRKCTAAEIEKVAGGRVWSGEEALAHGLVDTLGGFDAALREVRVRAGDTEGKLAPVVLRPRKPFFPGGAPLPFQASATEAAIEVAERVGLLPAGARLSFGRERVLALCPIPFESDEQG